MTKRHLAHFPQRRVLEQPGTGKRTVDHCNGDAVFSPQKGKLKLTITSHQGKDAVVPSSAPAISSGEAGSPRVRIDAGSGRAACPQASGAVRHEEPAYAGDDPRVTIRKLVWRSVSNRLRTGSRLVQERRSTWNWV